MAFLHSIFRITESIKQKHSHFKIKVASIKLYKIKHAEQGKLVELLSTYNVAQLDISRYNKFKLEQIPQCIKRVYVYKLECIVLSSFSMLKELHLNA